MQLRANRDLPSPRRLRALVVLGALLIAAAPVSGQPGVALGSPVLHRVEIFALALALVWLLLRLLWISYHGRLLWFGRLDR